ncbi:MAG: hypothetical protein EA382_01350 [Spirochaetaceae bacterium]|nr:MAG: hypothetical protein EA382_01350 [Spirochaetaceae bacterium]
MPLKPRTWLVLASAIGLMLSFWACSTARGESAAPIDATVTIDVTDPIKEFAGNPLGVNVNYWEDADAMRPSGSRSLADALKDLGVRYLRYPGGEKSDGHLWSVPPFDRPAPTLARIGPREWPSNDARVWSPPGDPSGRWARPIYAFDAFMDDCRSIGCEPVLVVAYDGIYKPAGDALVTLSREQAIETAVEWVRYANVERGYGVRYWMIGNEPWLETYMGASVPPGTYGRDVAEFAERMRLVDRSIKIGINGNSTEFFARALDHALDVVDFLAVHDYPAWSIAAYNQYIALGVDARRQIDAAIGAVPVTERDRIVIAVTETSSANFGIADGWQRNDLGKALINADIMMQMLGHPAAAKVLIWNTRWVHSVPSAVPHEFDLLTATNELTATGIQSALVAQSILSRVVHAHATSDHIRVMATSSPSGDTVNILVLNPMQEQSVRVRIRVIGDDAPRVATGRVFTGRAPTDVTPRITPLVHTGSDSDPVYVLPPLSLTSIEMSQ